LTPVSDYQKATATRAVEALEDLPAPEQVNRASEVYQLVFGLESWGDSSPSWLPTVTTIRLWRGWDSHRELLRRIQAVRESAYLAVGRSAQGLPISTAAARQSVTGAYVEGFSEGFSEGVDDLTDFGRGFADKLEALAVPALVLAAAIATIYVVKVIR